MVVVSLLCHYGESPLPAPLHKALKELASNTNNDILHRLANGISYSQVNFTQVANPQLLPYVINGAKSGSMSVKVCSVKQIQKKHISKQYSRRCDSKTFEQRAVLINF